MAEKIKQTVFTYANFAGINSFTYTINNVMFKPTHMIVRNISFISATAARNLVVLSSNLSAYRPLAVFATIGSGTVNLKTDSYFPLNKDINGTYTFNLLSYSNSPLSLTGSIGIQLELISTS